MDHLSITREELRQMLGNRPEDMHKGQCGRLLLVCGSFGMAGAAVMSASAAVRSGAGLVTVAAPREVVPVIQTAVPEAMCIEQEAVMYSDLGVYDAIGAGCGLGTGPRQYQMMEHLLLGYRGPLVIDADGINCLCRYAAAPGKRSGQPDDAPPVYTSLLPDMIGKRKAPVILTPHPGEAGRLLGCLEEDTYQALGRERSAEVLAERTGAIIVLKGFRTLIAAAGTDAAGGTNEVAGTDGADPQTSGARTRIYMNGTGNPGMACGGSGDVLTGVITALTASGRAAADAFGSGMDPMSAACAGVYIHGLAGDIAADRIGQIGMTAMDIVRSLPEAFRNVAGI